MKAFLLLIVSIWGALVFPMGTSVLLSYVLLVMMLSCGVVVVKKLFSRRNMLMGRNGRGVVSARALVGVLPREDLEHAGLGAATPGGFAVGEGLEVGGL